MPRLDTPSAPTPHRNARPLNLAVRPAFHAGVTATSSAGLETAVRSKVLARDNFTCVFCGFRAEKFQEIRPLNPLGIARMERADDWVTACHMCDQCLSLERVGMMGEGLLIWLPEMSQTELNHTVRALYLARSYEGELADAAKRGIDILKSRREEAKRRLGTDDPLILATVFTDYLSPDEYEGRMEKIEGIRLLSLDRRLQRTPAGEVDRFPDLLAFWRSKDGPYGRNQPPEWRAKLERLS